LTFPQIRKSTLPEEIMGRLLSLIQEKQLRPGDKLPPERELAILMNVSRPSLREALRALSLINVVDIRHGDGTYVTSLKPELLVEHLDFVVSLEDATYLQLLEARRVLEVGIVMIAAERISAEEVAELEDILKTVADCVHDHEAFLEADLALHDVIVAAAHNPMLGRLMASVGKLGRASRRRTSEIPGVPERVVKDHRAIVLALKRHDPEAARQAMLRHLRNVEDGLRQPGSPDGETGASPSTG
jgi:GntR family transcriptional repressor for pyruvate dehydrogenase complex